MSLLRTCRTQKYLVCFLIFALIFVKYFCDIIMEWVNKENYEKVGMGPKIVFILSAYAYQLGISPMFVYRNIDSFDFSESFTVETDLIVLHIHSK